MFEEEKQRQMELMQRSIRGLKGNIELTNLVTANKVHGHLKDNKNLLHEVNSMRHELRALLLENQKLKAHIDSTELRNKQKEKRMVAASAMKHDGGGRRASEYRYIAQDDLSLGDDLSDTMSYGDGGGGGMVHSQSERPGSKSHGVMNDILPEANTDTNEALTLVTHSTNPREPSPPGSLDTAMKKVLNEPLIDALSVDSLSQASSSDGIVRLRTDSNVVDNKDAPMVVKVGTVGVAEKETAVTNNYDAKLDEMMKDNEKEIKLMRNNSAAAEILNNYTNKYTKGSFSELSVDDSSLDSSSFIANAKPKANATSATRLRQSASKSVTLNDVVKFPSISQAPTQTTESAAYIKAISNMNKKNALPVRASGWKRNFLG